MRMVETWILIASIAGSLITGYFVGGSNNESVQVDVPSLVYEKTKTEEAVVYLGCKGMGVNKSAKEPDPRACDSIAEQMNKKYETQRIIDLHNFCTSGNEKELKSKKNLEVCRKLYDR